MFNRLSHTVDDCKIILIILIILFPSFAYAFPPGFLGAITSSANAGCNTTKNSNTGATSSYVTVGDVANGTKYVGTGLVTASSSYTVCKAQAYLYKNNSPTFTVTACIYNDNAGSPGNQVGTCSDAVSASTFPATEDLVTFSNMSASLTSGVAYWLVLITSALDNTNNIRWTYTATDVTNDLKRSGNGTSWSIYASRKAKFVLFSQ